MLRPAPVHLEVCRRSIGGVDRASGGYDQAEHLDQISRQVSAGSDAGSSTPAGSLSPKSPGGRKSAKAKVASVGKGLLKLAAGVPRAFSSSPVGSPGASPRSSPNRSPSGSPRGSVDNFAILLPKERYRDLARTVQGGGVYIAARRRLRRVAPVDAAHGNCSHATADMAFESLKATIFDELIEQSVFELKSVRDDSESISGGVSIACDEGRGLPLEESTHGIKSIGRPQVTLEEERVCASSVDDCDRDLMSGSVAAYRQADVQRLASSDCDTTGQVERNVEDERRPKKQIVPPAVVEMAQQVAVHISVSPGMQVTEKINLPTALWQPVFFICIGASQARVLTFAFVGDPVNGDRPDCKWTPSVLQLATSNLLQESDPSSKEAACNRRMVVRYVVSLAELETRSILEHVVESEEALFEAIDSGDWGRILAAGINGTSAKEIVGSIPSLGLPTSPD